MIKKVLIANRGEIACRVIRTARALGIQTVAVYSEADRQALHVKLADEAVYIGEAPAKESYLCGHKILEAAKRTNADAIHPGYGFLSENAHFAKACKDSNVIFIGPSPSAIEAMGSKSAAKTIMEKAGVPLVPGYHGDDQNEDTLRQAAEDMGYPVLLKAAAGGGGKGMRQVHNGDDFNQALAAAKREAKAGFGDDTMLVEKYLTRPRHIEFQVFCDSLGQGVYLFERDCSVQRRHQKIIEEAPAPNMSEALRKRMGDAALRAAQAINYVGAGTVEFLLDEDGQFYFMEMNTRLQVEHPVTEMITGEDLVAWQIIVAQGFPLPKQQHELTLQGHAFEARIYAENADNDFLPATGTLSLLEMPNTSAHVRIDTGVAEGDEVSVYYDPMIAKLIVWDDNRTAALQRLASALRAYRIGGVTTNTDYLHRLATHPAFVNAALSTTFIETYQDDLKPASHLPPAYLAVMAVSTLARDNKHNMSPWTQNPYWRMNTCKQQSVSMTVAGQYIESKVTYPNTGVSNWFVETGNTACHLVYNRRGNTLHTVVDGHTQRFTLFDRASEWLLFSDETMVAFTPLIQSVNEEDTSCDEGDFRAPMNGTIVACPVKQGDHVLPGTVLVVMEAMKMEHNIVAPVAGTVETLYCAPGDMVTGEQHLLVFKADE